MSHSSPASPPVTRVAPPPLLEKKRKLVWIEVARGIAATLVIFHHVSRHIFQEVGYVPFHGALDPGSAAVDFFFVLSGFLIMHVSKRDIGNPGRIGVYLRKRFLRIYPIYWVALAASYALHMASSNPEASLHLASVLQELTLWPRPAGNPTIVGVAWSLSYEIIFYLLFAAFLVNRSFGRIVFTAWSLAAILRIVGVFPAPTSGILQHLTSEYALLFPLGMAVSVRLRQANHPSARSVLALALPALAFLWYLQSARHISDHGVAPRLIYGVLSAILLYGLILLDHEGKTTRSRALLLLGECSYSVYLFHLLGMGVTAKVISVLGLYDKVPLALIAAAMISGGLAAGLTVGVWIERPLVRWARRVA